MTRWYHNRWLFVGTVVAVFTVFGALVVAASAASASHNVPATNDTAALAPAQLSPPVGLSPPVDLSPPTDLSAPIGVSPDALPATGSGSAGSSGYLWVALFTAVGAGVIVLVAGAVLQLRREG